MRAFIKSITTKLFYNNPKPLGRWNIEYCNNKMNRKIDMSNEDHCGPCGQYRITRMNKEKDKYVLNNVLNNKIM